MGATAATGTAANILVLFALLIILVLVVLLVLLEPASVTSTARTSITGTARLTSSATSSTSTGKGNGLNHYLYHYGAPAYFHSILDPKTLFFLTEAPTLVLLAQVVVAESIRFLFHIGIHSIRVEGPYF